MRRKTCHSAPAPALSRAGREAARVAFRRAAGFLLTLAPALVTPVAAYEFNEKVSLGGVASLAGQCQDLRHDGGGDDLCRGALPFQPALRVRPAAGHEFFFKLGFAVGDGLNDVTQFNVPPWAADLHDNVENINGTSRDHLLTAWYRYVNDLQSGANFGLTVGLIDATEFLDENVFANDEYVQFMSAALVNGPNVLLPSYAPGVALRRVGERISWTGVYMNVGRSSGDRYDFFGAQFGYHSHTALGRGNYRVLMDVTGRDFADPEDGSRERQLAALISLDQQFGKSLGGFLRLGQQSETLVLGYRSLYSGGVDIRGAQWGRPGDNIGVGYSYLGKGSGDVKRTRVAEVYYRFAVNPWFAVTVDVQYAVDDTTTGQSPHGLIFGIRTTATF